MLLFVIDSQTRALSSMIEVAELVTSGRVVVLVIEEIPEDAVIDGVLVGSRERKDMNRSRSYLADLVHRKGHPEARAVYSNVVEATVRAATIAKGTRTPMRETA